MATKAFIFDLDGVIVDTAVYHYQAWRRLANELGFDISAEFNEQLKGVSRVDSLNLILAHGGLVFSDERKTELADQKNAWYLELVNRMTPNDVLPGVPQFFAQTRQAGLKTALGSASKNAALILQRIGMADAFDAVMDGTKVAKSKPDPDVFLKAAEAVGVLPAESVVFEDAVAGVEAGKRGGMFVVGLGDAAVLTQADLVAPSLAELTVQAVLDQTR